jgi:two-component system cell cycle response regulator DivK
LTDAPQRRHRGQIARKSMARVLVVEDDVAIREILTRRLQQAGYQVVSAVNGIEALALAHAAHPELILMDLGLPLIGGLEATQRLKDAPDTSSIPIVALTAFATAEDRAKCLEVGCDEYESKPIVFERLFTKIQALLN